MLSRFFSSFVVGQSTLVVAFAGLCSGAGESLPEKVLRPALDGTWEHRWFSVDLELSENLMVIGSEQDSSFAPGNVHVYRHSDNSWALEQVIRYQGTSNVTGFWANRSFGSDIAISDDEQSIFVGAPSDAGTEYGAVIIYEHDATHGWRVSGKLLAPDGEELDRFGGTVEVSGGNLAVAAYRTDDEGFDSGSVYMFRRQANGDWSQVAKLTIPDARPSDLFGNILTIQGDLLVVSSVLADLHGNTSQGAVYTFVRNAVSGTWDYQGRLEAFDGSPGDYFGSALALSGEMLAVGAYGRSVPTREGFSSSQGSVYLYRRATGNDLGWEFVRLVKSDDGKVGDWFGRAVDFDDDMLLVGAAPWKGLGAAYVFRKDGGGIADNWRQVHKFVYEGETGRPFFGDDLAISAHTVVIGARDDDDIAWNHGAAFMFDRDFDDVVPAHHYDQWRNSHFGATALMDLGQRESLWGDAADPDGDGMPNLAEYFSGQHPVERDPRSARPIAVFSGSELSWSLPISTNPQVRASAYLQSGADLGSWRRVQSGESTVDQGLLELRIGNLPSFGSKQFFRVAIEED